MPEQVRNNGIFGRDPFDRCIRRSAFRRGPANAGRRTRRWPSGPARTAGLKELLARHGGGALVAFPERFPDGEDDRKLAKDG